MNFIYLYQSQKQIIINILNFKDSKMCRASVRFKKNYKLQHLILLYVAFMFILLILDKSNQNILWHRDTHDYVLKTFIIRVYFHLLHDTIFLHGIYNVYESCIHPFTWNVLLIYEYEFIYWGYDTSFQW